MLGFHPVKTPTNTHHYGFYRHEPTTTLCNQVTHLADVKILCEFVSRLEPLHCVIVQPIVSEEYQAPWLERLEDVARYRREALWRDSGENKEHRDTVDPVWAKLWCQWGSSEVALESLAPLCVILLVLLYEVHSPWGEVAAVDEEVGIVLQHREHRVPNSTSHLQERSSDYRLSASLRRRRIRQSRVNA